MTIYPSGIEKSERLIGAVHKCTNKFRQDAAVYPGFEITFRDRQKMIFSWYRSARSGNDHYEKYRRRSGSDALAAEFASRNVVLLEQLKDGEGLRGFEIKDADGYNLFFCRTRKSR